MNLFNHLDQEGHLVENMHLLNSPRDEDGANGGAAGGEGEAALTALAGKT